MRRKIYEKLLKWMRESKGKTALLIDGARRVGKTTSLTKYRRKFSRFLDRSYVLHTKDVTNDADGVFRIPIYMAPFLVSRDQANLTKGKRR